MTLKSAKEPVIQVRDVVKISFSGKEYQQIGEIADRCERSIPGQIRWWVRMGIAYEEERQSDQEKEG